MLVVNTQHDYDQVAVLSLVLTLLACGTDVPIAAQRHIGAGVADRTGHVCRSRQGSTIGSLIVLCKAVWLVLV